MILPFLNRDNESKRLASIIQAGRHLAVIYGRRRCGKSRLIREVLSAKQAVYYIADEREATLQREALAREIARIIDGFDKVKYPDWESLFSRWWKGKTYLYCLEVKCPESGWIVPLLPTLIISKGYKVIAKLIP
nr:hypothetical protein [Desulfobulbaceae bacterium]